MVRPTSAADINSRPVAASPVALMRDLDLLLRLSERIVKGCRLRGSVPLLACDDGVGHAGVAPTRRREGTESHVCHSSPRKTGYRSARLRATTRHSIRPGAVSNLIRTHHHVSHVSGKGIPGSDERRVE